jgi:hypothetical protein
VWCGPGKGGEGEKGGGGEGRWARVMQEDILEGYGRVGDVAGSGPFPNAHEADQIKSDTGGQGVQDGPRWERAVVP